MAAKFDTEDVLDMLLSVMKDSGALNAKILEIENEKIAQSKGLTPTLAPVADEAYYEQTWSDKILNTNPSIFYGIEDVQTQSGGGDVNAKNYTLFVEVVLVDSGQTNDIAKRVARYSRALEELFAKAFDRASQFGTVTIKTVRPMAFKVEMQSSLEIKVGGISLGISLA